MARSLRISVIIVTYNRPSDCDETINSLLKQKKPPSEIIIVDDASIPPYVPKIRNQHIKLIRISEELGLSSCRNIGLIASKGDIIAFIDDDAIAEFNWTSKMVATFDSQEADILGGLCKPIYFTIPPSWWSSKLLGKYVSVDNFFITGCNLAIRKSVFEELGYFSEKLGRQRGVPISNEEVELVIRARKAKKKILFDRILIVYHKVYPFRLRISYLMKRAWYQGLSIFLTFGGHLDQVLLEKQVEDDSRRTIHETYESSISQILTSVILDCITFLGYLWAFFVRTVVSHRLR